MPHYRDGTEVKVGDRVTLEFTVKHVVPAEDFCNVTLEIEHKGAEQVGAHVVVNTRQLIKVEAPPGA